MRTRKAVIAVTVILVLTVTAVVGALIGNPTVESVASTLLTAVVGVLVIHGTVAVNRTERRVRRVNSAVRDVAKHTSRPAQGVAREVKTPAETLPATSAADLIGTIRLLQAQYVGRLDRAQAALDAAVERVASNRRDD